MKTTKTNLRKTQHGFSLISVLFFLGLISIISAGILVQIAYSSKQYLGLKRRLEYVSYQNLLKGTLKNNNFCTCNFRNFIFDETNPQNKYNIPFIKYSCNTSSRYMVKPVGTIFPGADYTLSELYLTNIASTGTADEYTADIIAQPESISGVSQSNLAPINILFQTSSTSPPQAKSVLNCGPAPLSAPTGLIATRGDTSCDFNWNKSTGTMPITYNIKYSQTAGTSANGAMGCSTTNDNCTVKDLLNGTTYYFTVISSDSTGAETNPGEVSCTPYAPASQPDLSVFRTNSTSCAASWSPSSGTPVNNYELRYSLVSGMASSGTIAYSGNLVSSAITGLTTGVTYYFSVNATNLAGPSSFSDEEVCVP